MFSAASMSPSVRPEVTPPAPTQAGERPQNDADRFLATAMSFLGQPYRYGGGHINGTFSAPGPVDCSGLVSQSAKMSGHPSIYGTARVLQRKGQPVAMNELKPGDLVFKGNPAYHTGIYIGDGKVIHAPRTGDVVKIVSVQGWDSARRIFDEAGQAVNTAGMTVDAPYASGKGSGGDRSSMIDTSDVSGKRVPSSFSLPPIETEEQRRKRLAAEEFAMGVAGGGGGPAPAPASGGGGSAGTSGSSVGSGGTAPALGAPPPLPADWDFPLTIEELSRVLDVPVAELEKSLPYIIAAMKEAGIKDPNVMIGILATVKTEVGNFQPIREFADGTAYNNRADLGNGPQDGPLFKGRGFIQLTGRANYREYGRKLGIDLEGNPDLALRPDIAAKILVQYFKDRGLDDKAAVGDWRGVRKGVNGGFNGMDTFMATVNDLTSAARQQLA